MGLNFLKKYIKEAEFSRNGGFNAMMELLSIKDRTTAVVVTDDLMAFGAIDAAKFRN